MAIIYSYPLDITPATEDLLLGTSIADGNATKSYSIASLVGLVNTQGGVGTVTTVSTTNSDFINITGGPITSAGTLTASLSAGGTPSITTFLRGDNSWQPASSSGSAQISAFDEGNPISTDVDTINFTGLGVEVTQGNTANDIIVNVDPAVSAVTSIVGLTGITASSPIGDVEITNSGVTSIIAGANVTIQSTGAGGTENVTLNATNNPGTVQSVTGGDGLKITAGVETVNPSVGLDVTGSNNYILISKANTSIISTDFIPYNQTSTNNVKTTTLSTIPITALPLIKTYIDDGDAGTIKNSTDTFTSTAIINNVITIAANDYNAGGFTPNTNTLYILDPTNSGAGGTAVTVTLTTTNGIISPDGTGTGTGYDITGNVNGNQISGIPGEAYKFTTIITPKEDYYFTILPSPLVTQGVLASNLAIPQALVGTVVAAPKPEIKATLLVVTNIQGGPADGSGFTIGGSLSGSTQIGPTDGSALNINVNQSAGVNFSTTCTASTGYTFPVAPVIVNASGTINGSQTVVTTITGTLQLT